MGHCSRAAAGPCPRLDTYSAISHPQVVAASTSLTESHWTNPLQAAALAGFGWISVLVASAWDADSGLRATAAFVLVAVNAAVLIAFLRGRRHRRTHRTPPGWGESIGSTLLYLVALLAVPAYLYLLLLTLSAVPS